MRIVCFIIALLVPAAAAPAQPTPDGPSAWQSTLHDLASRLTQASGDEPALKDVTLTLIGRDAPASADDLLSRSAGTLVITTRTYLGPPAQAASDIATDFAASDLPEYIRQQFTFADPAAAASANKTAARWIGETLAVDDKAPVGLIVLWRGNQSLPSLSEDPNRHILFLLIAGETTDDQTVKIQRIVFGNPLFPAP